MELCDLKGLGPSMKEKLTGLGIAVAEDFLFHLPRSYQDRTRVCPLNQLQLGRHVMIEGDILHVEVKYGRRRMLLVHIGDASGYVIARFFHFRMSQYQQLQHAERVRAFGEVRAGRQYFEMIHPEYQLIKTGEALPLENRLTPIYPITEGVTQNRLRGWIQFALEHLPETQLPELLPESIRQEFDLPTLSSAIHFVHFPPVDAPVNEILAGRHPMQQRLAFEELLAHRLSLRERRNERHQEPAIALKNTGTLCQALLKKLPFTLTNAQQRVSAEINTDLKKPHAMLRLLQGDVGSGKTLVAMLAALQTIEAGYQAALMAPTEVLAEQHYLQFYEWLTPLGVNVVFLANKVTGLNREATLNSINDGTAEIIIGTQALFQVKVNFQKLALMIVDEQHRFGVEQRRALQQKGLASGFTPHQLVMTATPIPRTLAMTAYADLDVSVIDELPPGRTPITTAVIANSRRDEVITRLRQSCQTGHQAYWVCTLIEDSEAIISEAAEDSASRLTAELSEFKVGLVHGRMKPKEKTAVMQAFQRGDIQVLVATTVIEVGVDVPNASLMSIENPERLGLSQLHQLRGRVGRGSVSSSCVLLYQSPLSLTAKERLQIIRETQDGFLIAEKDLELRGPGELLGTRQTGDMQFRIASLLRDQALLPAVQQASESILCRFPEHAQAIIARWVGKAKEYAQV